MKHVGYARCVNNEGSEMWEYQESKAEGEGNGLLGDQIWYYGDIYGRVADVYGTSRHLPHSVMVYSSLISSPNYLM